MTPAGIVTLSVRGCTVDVTVLAELRRLELDRLRAAAKGVFEVDLDLRDVIVAGRREAAAAATAALPTMAAWPNGLRCPNSEEKKSLKPPSLPPPPPNEEVENSKSRPQSGGGRNSWPERQFEPSWSYAARFSGSFRTS